MGKRERFLSEMMENIRLSYGVGTVSYTEELGREFWDQTEEEYFQYIVDRTGQKAFILDLACGDGRHTLRFAERVGEVVGFDLSHNNLATAKKKCLVKDNVTFVEGSILRPPFPPNTFDGIWFSQAFEYVPPDKRRTFLTSLDNMLKDSGILYMSVETWQDSNIIVSLKRLWTDFKLFCYWKFIKRKPLLWGEFLEYISVNGWSGWHYHVHMSKGTLCKLLGECGFTVEKTNLYDWYIYMLCRKKSRKA